VGRNVTDALVLTLSRQVEAFLKANDADEKGLEGDAKKQANGERFARCW
jgi:hypothetical protein